MGEKNGGPPVPREPENKRASGWTEAHRWPPFTHGRVVCKCGNVVAQCRCPEGCRVVGTVESCAKCASGPQATKVER